MAVACLITAGRAEPGRKPEAGNWKLEIRKSKSVSPESHVPNRHSRGIVSGGGPRALIAYPAVGYSSYLGGSGTDVVTGAAADDAGNLYLTGYTNSTDLQGTNPTRSALSEGQCGGGADVHPCFDAFVAKIDPTGQRVIYAVYLGGSANDYATAIAVDTVGNAYITGYTNSTDLPTVNAVQPAPGGGACGPADQLMLCFDAFVAKLDSAGAAWNFVTYLGGTSDDLAESIAVDASGSAAVTGATLSTDFPVHGAMQADFGGGGSDGFVAKFEPSGARQLFSTYLGGSGDDFGTGIALDPAGGVYLTGYSNSPDLPTSPGPQASYSGGTCGALTSTFQCFDAYAAKFSADGSSREFVTYLGGTGGDYAHAIAVDAAGNVTVAGMTTSQDFPVTFGAFQTSGGGNDTDAFVVKLDRTGNSVAYSTYLGGTGAEAAKGVAVDAAGRAFITGYVHGSGFPLLNAVQAANGGFCDAFLAVLDEDGTAISFSTYLGGTGNDKARAVAVDRFGNAYVAGETFSADYPAARALQPVYAGGAFDAIATKLSLGDLPVLHVAPDQIDFGEQRVSTASEPRTVTLTNISAGELVFQGIEAAGDFRVSDDCASLATGMNCDVSLTFVPLAKGLRAGSLRIHHNGPEAVFELELAGTGVAPEIRLSSSSVSFGSQLVGTESGPRDIALTNPGTASLELSGIAVHGDFIHSNDCPASIPVNGGCTISVTFIPKAAGDHAGGVAVTNGLPEETRNAALAGNGTDFTLTTLPGEAVVNAGESATYTLTVSPLGGFRQGLLLGCSGAPKSANCSISKHQIELDGKNPQEVMVIVSTTRGATAIPPLAAPSWPGLLGIVCVMFCAANPTICLSRRQRRRGSPLRTSLVGAALLAFGLLMNACGGGGGNPTLPAAPQATPVGNYTLNVSATFDGVTRSTPVGLVVR